MQRSSTSCDGDSTDESPWVSPLQSLFCQWPFATQPSLNQTKKMNRENVSGGEYLEQNLAEDNKSGFAITRQALFVHSEDEDEDEPTTLL